jgi:hypothetical protein
LVFLYVLLHTAFRKCQVRDSRLLSPSSFIHYVPKLTVSFHNKQVLPHAQPPTWRTRVSPFVWASTFDLSSKGDPTSS